MGTFAGMKTDSSAVLDLMAEQHRPFRIDPHSHILPGIDDGSPGVEVSLRMARRAVAHGIEVVVATPHACHPAVRIPINADILRRRTAELQHVLNNEGIPLRLYPGQEYLLDERLPAMYEAGELITWADQGRYVLVELGFHHLHECVWSVLDYFAQRGLTPIIAHPERYTWWDEHRGVLERLEERSAFLQFNVMSINGLWGEPARDRAFEFMTRFPRWVLGTDAHSDVDRFWGIDKAKAILRSRAGRDREWTKG